MNILITGGAGFIGSNFVRFMLKKYPDYKIVNFDNLTYAGNLDNLLDIENITNYYFVRGDITNQPLVDSTVKEYGINIIMNFAAESHVDRSIEMPDVFIKTNVLGTQTLLNVAYQNNIRKYIQISTDEVYGSLGEVGYFTEQTHLSPNSPYSASKAAADLLVKAYYETFNLNINITRCSNNYGPYQFPEKLIPLIITNALQNKDIPIYGNGLNVRDWLHVEDHCKALDLVLHKGLPGEIYNIGGHNEMRNIDIVRDIVNQLGKSENLMKFVEDRRGHDYRYAINPNKILNELGWYPDYNFREGLQETVKWYLDNQKWWQNLNNKKICHRETLYSEI